MVGGWEGEIRTQLADVQVTDVRLADRRLGTGRMEGVWKALGKGTYEGRSG
jgi:hypothetical protein